MGLILQEVVPNFPKLKKVLTFSAGYCEKIRTFFKIFNFSITFTHNWLEKRGFS
jgi:hypothetical protein